MAMDKLLIGIAECELHRQCSDADLARLAEQLVSWEGCAPFLGISQAEEREIQKNQPYDYLLQKRDMLLRWKIKNLDNATYHQLITVFFHLENFEMIEVLKEIILNPVEVAVGLAEDPTLIEYRSFLMNTYKLQPHPGMLPNQTPCMKIPVYTNLTMIQKRLESSREIHVPITLQELFEETDDNLARTVVIKGVPGSGKTILTWYASQQWALKRMFQESFLLFISISLRHQTVQQATKLADLIPHPDSSHKKAIAQALAAKQGKGACFWFDGWDEMPEAVQRQSFVGSFIKRDHAGDFLPLCSIAVTTRPTDSLTSESSLMKEVMINNFTQKQIEHYITNNFEDCPENIDCLIGKIKEDGILQNFCSLPINLAIIVHLYNSFSMSLPKMTTKLFKCLILNLLLRNLRTRWTGHHIKVLKEFEKLPGDALCCFKNLCNTAFQGVMSRKTTFTEDEVEQMNLSLDLCTLSLMKISIKSEWYGQEQEITFLHYSVQEFLAAVHIASIEDHNEQAEHLQKLTTMENQQDVIHFFAGITNLQNMMAQKMIMQVCKEPLIYVNDLWGGKKERLHSFLLLVRCIYETQSQVLHQIAFKMLLSVPKLQMYHVNDLITNTDTSIMLLKNQFQLDFYFEPWTVSSMDLKALGYFIGNCCKDHVCRLRIIDCLMYDNMVANFINEIVSIHRQTSHLRQLQPSLSLTIHTLNFDTIDHNGIKMLCGLIKDMPVLSSLSLQPAADTCALWPQFRSMKYIIEAFSRNTSCSMLHLTFLLYGRGRCLQTEYYFLLLLTFCRGIKELGLHFCFSNNYGPSCLFTAALQHNHNLVFLDLSRNPPFSDGCVLYMGEALQSNYTLLALGVGRSLAEQQLTKFLNLIIDSPLCILVSTLKINEEHKLQADRLVHIRKHSPQLREKRRIRAIQICDSIEKALDFLAFISNSLGLQL